MHGHLKIKTTGRFDHEHTQAVGVSFDIERLENMQREIEMLALTLSYVSVCSKSL